MDNDDTGPAGRTILPDREAPADPVPPDGRRRSNGSWWPAVQAAGLAYGLTVGAALVLMALLVLGFFLGGAGALNGMNDSAGRMGAELDGPSALVIYPFFLAAMALGGTTVLTVSAVPAALGAPLVSVWAGILPLVLTFVAAGSLWRLGRRAERKAPLAGGWLRWLHSAVTGLALAAVAVVFSLMFSLRGEAGSGAFFLTAASPSLVAGAVLLGTGATWGGRKSAAGGTVRLVARADRALPGLRAALRIAGAHYLAFTAVAGAALFTAAWFTGGAAVAFAAPLWLPTAAAWAYSAGHLSGLAVHGMAVPAFPGSVFDLPVWAGAGAGALTVLLAAAASVAWAAGRDNRPETLARPASWLTLPAVFGLAGAAASVLSLVVTGEGLAGGTVGGGPVFGTIGPARLTFLVLAAWGALIELGARTLARHVVHRVPPRAAAWLRSGRAASPGSGAAGPETSTAGNPESR